VSMKQLREEFHAQFLHIRNCNYLIQSDNFEIAYKNSTIEEQKQIEKDVCLRNKLRIKKFIFQKVEGDFEEMGIRKLREIGKFLKIEKYYFWNKATLIEEIRNEIQSIKTNSKSISN